MSKKRKLKRKAKTFSIICLFLALGICLVAFIPKYFNMDKAPVINNIPKKKKKEEPKIKVSKISVIATGDALIHSGVYKDAWNGSEYDFSKQLDLVAPIVKNYDLAYYNQETIFGGEELGYSNYPMFNTPSHLGIDMQEAGFNMVSMATNHSMDKGEKGAINAINFWREQKDVLAAGMYLSEEDRNTDRIFEKNGITYTMLNYTYGTNGLPVPQGKDYLVNVWPTNLYLNDPANDTEYQNYKEVVKEDIQRVRDKVDVLFVAMHWGVEYTHTPTAYEEDMAKFLADNGVDVIIGAHPHCIQPLAMIDDTLVIYSLGNFISAQEGEMKLVGMLASFDITKTEEKGNTTIKVDNVGVDLTWTYYNSAWRDFKVVPFSVMEDKYLYNNEAVYNKYKEIIDRSNFEVNVKGLKSGFNTEANQE